MVLSAHGAKAASPVHAAPNPDGWSNAFNTWSIGAGVGYNFFQTPATIDSFGTYSDAASPTLQGNSPNATVEIGKDLRFNNVVFGLYGDAHLGEKVGAFDSSDEYAPHARLSLGPGGSLTGRLGVVANPRTLVYGLFGWSWQQYDSFTSSSDYTLNNLTASGSGVLNGPTIGLGAEVLFKKMPNVSLKAEYRYTHFDAPAPLSPTTGKFTTFGNVDDQSVRLVLSFKLPQG